GFKPTVVITNSETLLSWQRESIERVFNCHIYDYYGTAEYMLFAGQNKDSTYHVSPIIGITEVLNPCTRDSFGGQLLATSLTNYYVPLLRYDSGDIAETQGTRSKDTVTYVLTTVHGRKDDYIKA